MKTTRVVVCVVLFCSVLLAQSATPSTATQRDQAAVAVLQSAVNVLGGAAGVSSIESCTASGQIQSLNRYWPSGTASWEVSGKYLHYQATYPNGTETVVIGPRGGRLTPPDGQAHRLSLNSSLGDFVPFMVAPELYRRATDTRFAVIAGGTVTIGTTTAVRVRTWLDTDEIDRSVTYQEWFFDAQTGVPVRVAYRYADNSNALATIPVVADLANYQAISGIAFPFRVTLQLDGEPWRRLVLSSIVVNPGISPSAFELPAGGAQ